MATRKPLYRVDGGPAEITGTDTIPASTLPVMVGSGASHAPGAVPDPGASAGTTKFLREDGSWAVPAGGGGSAPVIFSTTLFDFTTAGVGSVVVVDNVVDFLISDTTKPANPQYTRTVIASDIPTDTMIATTQLILSIGGKNTDVATRTINWIATLNGVEIGTAASLSLTTGSPWWVADIMVAANAIAVGDVIGLKMWASVTNVVDCRYAFHYYIPRTMNGASDTGAFYHDPGISAGVVAGSLSGVTVTAKTHSAFIGTVGWLLCEATASQITISNPMIGTISVAPQFYQIGSTFTLTNSSNLGGQSVALAASTLHSLNSFPRYLRRVTLST